MFVHTARGGLHTPKISEDLNSLEQIDHHIWSYTNGKDPERYQPMIISQLCIILDQNTDVFVLYNYASHEFHVASVGSV